ncbi:hypothetical protein DFR79_10393 [Halanaerobium saccharolyticum]|uniref:Regulator of cell morphogenesis and NO signaling n=1 Tax=Halanaerobium saccharolyticum TaxID=43595 RepID=A0A4R6M1I2_9FIRM|nr:DUF438 domain-containing protein [Halanaerobium saccharolyticum]TDO94415.1 hypothetical protein DFR79_10393 [Halanaerobium saccharolyticum]
MTAAARKEELKNLLERLNSGQAAEEVKKEAQELIESISAKELSEAEQELINEGLDEKELRHLCTAHIEAMAEELKELKTNVPVGHPLSTLIAEHEEILKILDRLDQVNSEIQTLESYDAENPVFEELKELGAKLLDTEKHHTREEETLFPEVDKSGVTGPTRIMRMEHDDLWPHKEKISELAEKAGEIDFDKFKKELKEHTEYVVVTLRDHIFKENNILYPTAKDVIEESKWEEIKAQSDQIGYCGFTPEAEINN